MKANPTVTPFFQKARNWKAELLKLRDILLESELTEELKWRQPCYTLNGKNVAIISAFKDRCIVGYFKGALMNDYNGLLQRPGQHAQSVRHLSFTSIDEIRKSEKLIRDHVRQAIEIERSGRQVTMKTTSDYPVPDELLAAFKKTPGLKRAFGSLTPGRQRGYLLFFSGARQSATRSSRIEKCRQRIMDGKGLRD